MSIGINGVEIVLFVSDDGGTTYKGVGGQRDMQISGTAAEIDASSKNQAEEVTLRGRITQEITLDHLYFPGDAAFDEIQSAIRSGDKVKVAIYDWDSSTSQYKQRDIADGTVLESNINAPDSDVATASSRIKVDGWTGGDDTVGTWPPA